MSTTGPVAVAVACGNTLGETATWSVREQAVYWVDIRDSALHRYQHGSGLHQSWPMPELCGAVVPAPNGVVLALRRSLVHLDTASSRLTPLCEVEPAVLDNRLNEAKCDRSGRLWLGSMRDYGLAITGSLYRIGRDLRVTRVLENIAVPNSLAWSPDARTMYFADTADGVLRAYDTQPADGSLGGMHPLSDAGTLPGRPDGCAVDSEGHVWNARYGAGRVIRIAPDGRVTATVALPATQVTSCTLGGPDLRTLFVTTARQRLSPAQLAAQPLAGHLFAIPVDVAGLPDIEFDFGNVPS